MAKFTKIQNNFLFGEISPRLFGRTDFDAYSQGVKTLENFKVFPQGGISKRPGSILIDETDNSGAAWSESLRLIPFVFSQDEAYVFILGTNTELIYDIANDSYITPTGISGNSYQLATTYSGKDELDNIQTSQSGDILVLTSDEGRPNILARTSASTFEWANINRLPILVRPTRIRYTGSNENIQTKYSSSEIASGSFFQYPFEDYNAVDKLGTSLSGTPNATSATSPSTLRITGLSGDAEHSDNIEWIGLVISGVTGYAYKNGAGTDTYATGNDLVGKAFGGTTASDSILLPQWRTKAGWGFPRCVSFFQQRLIFANNDRYLNKIWASQTGDITEVLSELPVDATGYGELSNDRPFEFILASGEINRIQWMLPFGNSLLIGTLGGEYIANSGTSAESFGPLAVNIQKETSFGSEPWIPISFDGSVVFIERGGLKLREFIYNRDENAFRANDISLFSEHLPRYSESIFASSNGFGFEQIYYQKSPYQTVWAKDKNDYIFSLTRERNFGANAWSRIELGGESATDEPPKVLTMCVVPDTDGQDDVYMMVKRTVNGSSKVTFEKMARPFEGNSVNVSGSDIGKYPVYVDAAQLLDPESSVTFMVAYDTSLDANVYNDNQKATAVGSPSISNGKLDLTGGTAKYVEYQADGNADAQQTGSIRIRVTPGYTGSPSANQTFIAISKASGDADNLIEIYHTSGGSLGYVINDSTGSQIATGSSAWSPTSGTEYELLLTYDLTGGDNDLYVDGSAHANDSGTGTRDANISYLVIGTDEGQNNDPDFSVSYFAVYSDENAGTAVNARIYGKYVQTQGSLYYGQTLQAISDGQFLGDLSNEYGHLVLSSGPGDSKVLIGFKYVSKMESLDIEAGSILGSAQGQTRRIEEVMLRFDKTVGGKYGSSFDNLEELEFRNYQYGDDEAIQLYTGDRIVKLPQTYGENCHVVFQHDLPFPCYLSCLVYRGLTYD